MDGAQVGMPSWEDLGSGRQRHAKYKYTKIDYITYGFLMVTVTISLLWANPFTVVLVFLGFFVFVIRLIQIVKIIKSQK